MKTPVHALLLWSAFAATALGTAVACRDARSNEATRAPHALSASDTAVATPGGRFVSHTIADSGKAYRYQVWLPTGYDSTKKWPVIVYLAGSAEMGEDGMRQTTSGIGAALRHGLQPMAIVAFPQSPSGEHGVGRGIFRRLVMPVVDSVMKNYSTDPDRLYITGYSYGGSVAYEMLPHVHDRFAAGLMIAAPVCVACMDGNMNANRDTTYHALASSLATLPLWIFQGAQDRQVAVSNTRLLVRMLTENGAHPRYTEYADGDHGIGERPFASFEVIAWLLSQKRGH